MDLENICLGFFSHPISAKSNAYAIECYVHYFQLLRNLSQNSNNNTDAMDVETIVVKPESKEQQQHQQMLQFLLRQADEDSTIQVATKTTTASNSNSAKSRSNADSTTSTNNNNNNNNISSSSSDSTTSATKKRFLALSVLARVSLLLSDASLYQVVVLLIENLVRSPLDVYVHSAEQLRVIRYVFVFNIFAVCLLLFLFPGIYLFICSFNYLSLFYSHHLF
jgi:hypothetical protein